MHILLFLFLSFYNLLFRSSMFTNASLKALKLQSHIYICIYRHPAAVVAASFMLLSLLTPIKCEICYVQVANNQPAGKRQLFAYTHSYVHTCIHM